MERIQKEARLIKTYDIKITPEAQKGLLSVSQKSQRFISDAIDELSQNPRPDNSLRLVSTDNLRRLTVGDYRVIYGIEEKLGRITIELVRHRSVAYTILDALNLAVRKRGTRYSR